MGKLSLCRRTMTTEFQQMGFHSYFPYFKFANGTWPTIKVRSHCVDNAYVNERPLNGTDTKDTKYYLRPRTHNLKITVKNSFISQSDFITRMLFKDVY